MPAPKCLVDREARLRAGYVEEQHLCGLTFYFYWEPHFDHHGNGVRDFVIEIVGGVTRKEYIHHYEEAVKKYEELERKFVIEEMARALLGPQDTVQIRRPPTFK
jgi:hypothetical protein